MNLKTDQSVEKRKSYEISGKPTFRERLDHYDMERVSLNFKAIKKLILSSK